VDPSGNINVVWVDSTPGNFDILFTRSGDQGATHLNNDSAAGPGRIWL